MRAIHFVRPSGSPHIEPLCGDWGSMATHWTEDAAGVSCRGCLDVLRDPASSGARRGGAPPGGSQTV